MKEDTSSKMKRVTFSQYVQEQYIINSDHRAALIGPLIELAYRRRMKYKLYMEGWQYYEMRPMTWIEYCITEKQEEMSKWSWWYRIYRWCRGPIKSVIGALQCCCGCLKEAYCQE